MSAVAICTLCGATSPRCTGSDVIDWLAAAHADTVHPPEHGSWERWAGPLRCRCDVCVYGAWKRGAPDTKRPMSWMRS